MTRSGVRPVVLLGLFAGVGVVSFGLWRWITESGSLVPRPSWLAAVLLVAMAAFVIGFARPVRAYRAGRARKPLDPLYAARVVVLAQAAALTGAAAAGWYAGQVGVVASDLSLVANHDRLWRLAVLALAAVLLLIAGLVAQRWCRIDPPQDRDDESVSAEAG